MKRYRYPLSSTLLCLATAAVTALVTASPSLGASVTAVVASHAPDSSAECIGVHDNARIRAGATAGEPNDLSIEESLAAEQAVAAELRRSGISPGSRFFLPAITIDVHVHVITAADGTGGVTRQQISDQIAVLNDGFAGRSWPGSARTIFRFAVKSVDYTPNDDWYSWTYDPSQEDIADDTEAKAALHQGGFDDLNVYIAGLEGGLLGYATFPWETTLTEDGVVLLNESLPGGSAAPYNRGDTATHEVGHWLGLLHTFENGCVRPGDQVADTPYQFDGENIFGCVESDDTCRAPGKDPVHNFMSYGDDPCLDRFSPGQSLRMGLVWLAFRR